METLASLDPCCGEADFALRFPKFGVNNVGHFIEKHNHLILRN